MGEAAGEKVGCTRKGRGESSSRDSPRGTPRKGRSRGKGARWEVRARVPKKGVGPWGGRAGSGACARKGRAKEEGAPAGHRRRAPERPACAQLHQ